MNRASHRRLRRGGPLIAGTLGLLLLSPNHSSAFECLPTNTCVNPQAECGTPDNPLITQGWNQRCIPFWIRAEDPLLNTQEHEAMIMRVFETWSSNLRACTDLSLIFAGYTEQSAEGIGNNPRTQRNIVMAALDSEEALSLFNDDPTVVAITRTDFSSESGEIFDADIILNYAEHQFDLVSDPSACSAIPTDRPYDLENVLTHEVGHFLGFEHVTDQDATMFSLTAPCEVAKRTLTTDDENAICETYSIGEPVNLCTTRVL